LCLQVIKRRYAIGVVAAAVLALGLGAAGASPASRPVVYGASIVDHITGTWSFQRLDARTLRALRSGAHFGPPDGQWSFSPDRTKLALGSDIVDLSKLRTTRQLAIPNFVVFDPMWVTADRLVAIGNDDNDAYKVVTVDPRTGRVVHTATLGVSFQDYLILRVTKTTDGVAFLLASFQDRQPTTLVLAGIDGSVRQVRLDRVLSGSQLAQRVPYCCFSVPALAIDSTGSRAFVTAAGAPIAEVDLASLQVAYHDLGPAFGRLARAKVLGGAIRSLAYLPSGELALTGSSATGGDDAKSATTPAGLTFVDTRTWAARTIDPGTTGALLAGDELLGFGAYGPASSPARGVGVTVYSGDGTRLHHRLGHAVIGSAALTGRYVYLDETALGRRSILDLVTGKIVRRGRIGPTMIFGEAHAAVGFAAFS
jgi:hypothetical protein